MIGEHNRLELVLKLHKSENYVLFQKEGRDNITVHCVKGCRCHEGHISADITEIPVSVRHNHRLKQKADKCHMRFSAVSQTGLGVPDARITAAGFGCAQLHLKTHIDII